MEEPDAGWSSSVARWAHNPEVEGSNPSPATKFAGQRPLPIMEGAFCVCRVHGIVHEVPEGPQRRLGGEAYPADVVLRRRRRTTSTQMPRPLICDKLQMKCNLTTMGP